LTATNINREKLNHKSDFNAAEIVNIDLLESRSSTVSFVFDLPFCKNLKQLNKKLRHKKMWVIIFHTQTCA